MEQKTFLFYDIETTGLSSCFDQIVQFAAIRTDLALNELESYNIFVKINPDVIPSPQALLTHNIPLEKLQKGMCEYEAICKIHELVNRPQTISIGYNTLNFDDEFLRFSFYRNLLPPYTHQYANNCGRADIYPCVAMFYLYKKRALNWPKIDGKVSLRLENLVKENHLVEGNAHDALVDVKATIALARIFIKYPDMWRYLLGYFDKTKDLGRILKLSEALIVDGGFGADNNYQAYTIKLGTHNHYKNQVLWLRLDKENLSRTKPDVIPETTRIVRKKPGEIYFLLPPEKRFIKLNKDRCKIVDFNKQWLQNNPDVFQKIASYYKEYKYPVISNVDVDAALYINGFLNYEEQELCKLFYAGSIENKAKMIERFANSNLRQQAIRVLGRNYPQYLSNEYKAEFENYLVRINADLEKDFLIDYRGNKKFSDRR